MNVRRLVSLFAALGLGVLGSTGCGVSRISEIVGDDDGVSDGGIDDGNTTVADDDGNADDGNDDDPLPPILDVSQPVGETCEEWAKHYLECYSYYGYYNSYDELVDNCESWIDDYENWYGPECASAFEDYFACISALPCNWDGPGEWPCSDASIALEEVCWNQPIPG